MSTNTLEAPSSSNTQDDSFLSNLLKPGSSLNPNFLRILDAAFIALLSIFLILLFLLSGSIHIVFLIIIELCLWASVKWFVNELKAAQSRTASTELIDPNAKKSQ